MARPKGSTTVTVSPEQVRQVRECHRFQVEIVGPTLWEKVADILHISRSTAIKLYKKAKQK